MVFMNMRGDFIQVQCQIQNMDMRVETLIYDFHKFCDNLNKQFRWNMIVKRSNSDKLFPLDRYFGF